MITASRTKPQSVVTFYTEMGNLVLRATNDPNQPIDNDILSIKTSRDMGADAPTFSIVLARRKLWHKWIGSNDLLTIEMCRPPETLNRVFVGLVDDCRKTVTMSADGTPERTVTVSGRGVAKAFIQFDSGVVPESEVIQPNVGWIIENNGKLGGSSCDVVLQSIWDNIGKKFVNYTWNNGKSLFDEISYSFKPRPNLTLADDTSISNWQGSLWALMREIAERPFYELYWEVDSSTNTPVLYCRPTPFSQDDWNALPTSTVTDTDVLYDDTGRSDVETYSIFSVGAKMLFSPNDPYSTFATFPLWNKEFAKKYGIRRLHASTMYLGIAAKGDIPISRLDTLTNENIATDSTTVLKGLQTDLYNWNIKNSSMYNGMMYVKGSNSYKVGTRLIYDSDEDQTTTEYYIIAVHQNFVNFGNWVTQLSVIRGCSSDDRFTSPYGESVEFSGLMGKYSPDAAMKAFLGTNNSSGLDNNWVDTSGKVEAVVAGAKSIMNEHRIHYSMGSDNYASGYLDCSSFTQYVFSTYAGMEIGRTTGDQVTVGKAIQNQSDLMPGDLILFKDTYASGQLYGSSHVGIWVGNGEFIHCSSGAGTVIQSPLSNAYWQQHWLMGRRVIVPTASLTNANANSDVMNRVLGGVLKGMASEFIMSANNYGVDPVLIAAIAMHETGNGTSSAIRNKNNPGGLMGSHGLMTFDDLRSGIDCMSRTIQSYGATGTINEQISQIGAIYCPVGAANDPNGLNGYWVPGVIKFYAQLSGQ